MGSTLELPKGYWRGHSIAAESQAAGMRISASKFVAMVLSPKGWNICSGFRRRCCPKYLSVLINN